MPHEAAMRDCLCRAAHNLQLAAVTGLEAGKGQGSPLLGA